MLVEILLFLVAAILLLYRYITKNFDRYEKLGLAGPKPSFPFGTHYDSFMMKMHLNQECLEMYRKYPNEKVIGTFMFGKPVPMLMDPELIKQVCVKDFYNFVDRIDPINTGKFFGPSETDQIWAKQLTSLSGDEWKDVRSAFSPIFTSGKLKVMMRLVKHVSDSLVDDIMISAKSGEDFETKEKFGKFSMDSIASCAFGVDPESFTNKDSTFVKNAARIFTTKPKDMLMILLALIPGFQTLNSVLKLSILPAPETKFFARIINQTIENRKKSKEKRNDMVDMMLDALREDSSINKEDEKENNNHEDEQFEKDSKLTHDNRKTLIDEASIVATALIMLVAGYDTTGMAISFASYELANNPDIQEKLQEEIDEAFDEAGDKLPDYNVIQNLPYLDQVIHETLRIHTAVGWNSRSSIGDYTIPGTNIQLKQNDMVAFNVIGIHMNPEYYPNPETFNPDNFSKEAKAARHPFTFLAFGQGPRGCIGMRFALLEAKIALAAVLRKFKLVRSEKTKEPLEIDASSQLAYIKGGLWIKAEER